MSPQNGSERTSSLRSQTKSFCQRVHSMPKDRALQISDGVFVPTLFIDTVSCKGQVLYWNTLTNDFGSELVALPWVFLFLLCLIKISDLGIAIYLFIFATAFSCLHTPFVLFNIGGAGGFLFFVYFTSAIIKFPLKYLPEHLPITNSPGLIYFMPSQPT